MIHRNTWNHLAVCKWMNSVQNYLWGTEDVEDLRKVCPKGAQRSERKKLSWQQGDGQADQFRSRSSWCSGDLRWKLDLLLWPRDQVEVPSRSMLALPDLRRPDRANPPTNFWWSLFFFYFFFFFLTALTWSTCTGFPLDRQSTRNTMFRF